MLRAGLRRQVGSAWQRLWATVSAVAREGSWASAGVGRSGGRGREGVRAERRRGVSQALGWTWGKEVGRGEKEKKATGLTELGWFGFLFLFYF